MIGNDQDVAAGASTIPARRANPDLVGHEAAEGELRRLVEAGRLPHALLLSGPRGIGKATLAFRLARFLFAQETEAGGLLGGDVPAAGQGLWTDPQSGPFRRVVSGGHADLLTAELGHTKEGRLRREIVVADIREIGTFLHLTPAEGGWRVVIVDGADAMNRNAQNALLKTLEEPPRRTLLVLVTHNPGTLLPTIRSRCRRFPVSPLPAETVRQLLVRYRPDLAAGEADAVTALCAGSIGGALGLAAAGGVGLYRTMLALLRPAGEIDAAAVGEFADRLARRGADKSWRVVEELLAGFLARLAVATARGNAASGPLAKAEAETMRRLSAPAARWAALRGEIAERFARTDGLNLDRKQAIMSAFFAIGAAAG